MINFFHKLLNPHCPHCREEKYEDRICQSCEVLKDEIARLRAENNKLLDSILNPRSNEPAREVDLAGLKPLRSSHVPWNTRRQMLEVADRDTAEKRRQAEKNEAINKTKSDKPISSDSKVEELERELLEGEVNAIS